jgi:hypothetical protein
LKPWVAVRSICPVLSCTYSLLGTEDPRWLRCPWLRWRYWSAWANERPPPADRRSIADLLNQPGRKQGTITNFRIKITQFLPPDHDITSWVFGLGICWSSPPAATALMIAHHEVGFDTPSVRHAFGPCGMKDPAAPCISDPKKVIDARRRASEKRHLDAFADELPTYGSSFPVLVSLSSSFVGMELISRPANMIRIIS